MPKETTHHGKQWKRRPATEPVPGQPISESTETEYRPGEPLKDGETVRDDPSFEVSWSKDSGHVQASILFSREQWMNCLKMLEEDPEIYQLAIYTGTWTRQEINNTIRVLRRARDQAFGADE